MNETKNIQKTLQSNNYRLITDTFEKYILEGWRRNKDIPTRTSPYRIVLNKEVYIDSKEPDVSVDFCKPEGYIGGTVEIYQGERPLEVTSVIIDDAVSDNEEVVDSKVTPSENVLSTDVQEPPELSYKIEDVIVTLDDAEGKVHVISGFREDDDIVVEKSEDVVVKMFEKRAYSKDELDTWEWAKITQLAAALEVKGGNKVERVANIVIQSELQWSQKSE